MTITVYTKPDCVQCHALYIGLFVRGILDVDIVNLATNEAALETIKQKGYLRAPVLVTELDSFSENDTNKLDELAQRLQSSGVELTPLSFQDANARAQAIKKQLKEEVQQALAA